MNIINRILGRYRNDSETVIISCFFNPLGSEYRKKAFDTFYQSIKHLNHRIIECVIGDSKPQLPENEFISRVHTRDLLWHKETLLNNLVKTLPKQFKYVLWVDADVIFTNKNWMVDAANELRSKRKIVQLFEYCVHLNKDETEPSFTFDSVERQSANKPHFRRKDVWKSFASVCVNKVMSGRSEIYDEHGHVGFAWGARRSLLEEVPLYDKALIGGADHIIAHAAAGHISFNHPYPKLHNCIEKSFTADLIQVTDWSRKFMSAVGCSGMGYIKGDLYHIWHGDVDKRDYFRRIKEFTPKSNDIKEKDANGLYLNKDSESNKYLHSYFEKREVLKSQPEGYHHGDSSRVTSPTPKRKSYSRDSYGRFSRTNGGLSRASREREYSSPDIDDGFLTSMAVGYATDSTLLGTAVGRNVMGAAIGEALRGEEKHGMRPDSTATPLSTPRTYADDPKDENPLDNSGDKVDTDAQNCGNFS